MTIERPNGLDCPRCGVMPHQLKRASAQVKGRDYFWRYMICRDCGEHFWWGSPLTAGKSHQMMKITPKLDDYGETININLSLPIPTTLKALALKAREVQLNAERKAVVDMFLRSIGKTLEQLTIEEKQQLIRILKEIK